MISQVARTLVPRTTNFVAKRAFSHETMVSGPPRVKISSAEKVSFLDLSLKNYDHLLFFTRFVSNFGNKKTATIPAPSVGQKFKLTSKKTTSDMKGSVTIRFVALNTSSYSTLFANSTTEFPSGRRNIINTVYRLEEHCK